MNHKTQIDLTSFYNSDEDVTEFVGEHREVSETEAQKMVDDIFPNLPWDVRHKETREMKNDVFDWLDTNYRLNEQK